MQDQPRLHVEPPAPLAAGARLPVRPEQAHYLGTVLRRGAGDVVRLFNARDGEWAAAIESLHRGRGHLAVTARLRPPVPEPGPILLFAPVKRDATDLIVRMATELGARALWPVLTERTNAARVKTERLLAIATEAAEQCERLSVPLIDEPQPLVVRLAAWPSDRVLLAAIERQPGTAAAGAAPVADAVLIGPEGGFTQAELDVLRARPFVTAISLGSRILRAETAAVAALACLQSAREQWAFVRDHPQGGGPQTPHPPAMPAEPDVQPG